MTLNGICGLPESLHRQRIKPTSCQKIVQEGLAQPSLTRNVRWVNWHSVSYPSQCFAHWRELLLQMMHICPTRKVQGQHWATSLLCRFWLLSTGLVSVWCSLIATHQKSFQGRFPISSKNLQKFNITFSCAAPRFLVVVGGRLTSLSESSTASISNASSPSSPSSSSSTLQAMLHILMASNAYTMEIYNIKVKLEKAQKNKSYSKNPHTNQLHAWNYKQMMCFISVTIRLYKVIKKFLFKHRKPHHRHQSQKLKVNMDRGMHVVKHTTSRGALLNGLI